MRWILIVLFVLGTNLHFYRLSVITKIVSTPVAFKKKTFNARMFSLLEDVVQELFLQGKDRRNKGRFLNT
jgi:hypothetical protein